MGEIAHETGRQGASRAKRWLERTTRVDVPWINPDAAEKLTFPWADGSTFSFDLGGLFKGSQIHGQEFLGEVKRYASAGDQGALYAEYLAKCYRAFSVLPARCDHFIWITWHPFSQTKWSQLCSSGEVRDAVLAQHKKCLGINDPDDAPDAIDASVCDAVAQRLWLIVLSDKQEGLVIEDDDLDEIWARQRRRNH